MGLMDKFKTLFTVEVDDEPIKKEVIKVQIDTPVEEKKEVVKETKEVEFGETRFQGDLIPYKTSKTTDKRDAALVEFNKEVESIERSENNVKNNQWHF